MAKMMFDQNDEIVVKLFGFNVICPGYLVSLQFFGKYDILFD